MQPISIQSPSRRSSVGPLTEADLDAAIAFNASADCSFEPWHLPHMGHSWPCVAGGGRCQCVADEAAALPSVEAQHPWVLALYAIGVPAGFVSGWAARALS
jgi:hypothetical protein